MPAYINFIGFRRSPNSFEDSYWFIESVLRRPELAVSRHSGLHGQVAKV